MAHKVFIRHTYIYKCSDEKCGGEWKVNEASDLEKIHCPHCGKKDTVNYVMVDQREKYQRRWEQNQMNGMTGTLTNQFNI